MEGQGQRAKGTGHWVPCQTGAPGQHLMALAELGAGGRGQRQGHSRFWESGPGHSAKSLTSLASLLLHKVGTVNTPILDDCRHLQGNRP